MSVSFPQAGGCLCGAVRYAIREDPLFAYACHCTDCQTASGSSFALCLTASLDTIDVVAGSPAERTVHFRDGREWRFAACDVCETRIWSLRRATPDLVGVRAGTLDDARWVHPVGHIWVESALDWSPIESDAIVFPREPDEVAGMIRAWRRRTPRLR